MTANNHKTTTATITDCPDVIGAVREGILKPANGLSPSERIAAN